MLRRITSLQSSSSATLLAGVIATSQRTLAHEHKQIVVPHHDPPKPPMIPYEPVMPMDFNPHIEWFEYPKEIFNPKYPYTREESIRMTEEAYESTMDEMAQRYGMRLNFSSKPTYWMAWFIMNFYCWQTLWGCYRGMGTEPGWPVFRAIVEAQPNCPTIDEDDIYLDQWIRPASRERMSRYDKFYQWKPLVNREGATKHDWAIPHDKKDVSEWVHMTSRC